jgi:hypothetical protein
MAHFAELDSNNVVKRVVVVSNRDCSDANGMEKESIGIAHCEWLFGGRWIQTSYNGNFRKRFAGVGTTYNADLDAFVPAKTYQSWVLDPDLADWVAPIPKPSEEGWEWDEVTTSWVPAIVAPSSPAS